MNREERRKNGNRGPDTRIAYGIGCSWWGPIQKVGINAVRLPCCPSCSGLLMEFPTRDAFMAAVPEFEKTHPGYGEFILWLEGKCFEGKDFMKTAGAVYETETGKKCSLELAAHP